jgi:hypothetical protein
MDAYSRCSSCLNQSFQCDSCLRMDKKAKSDSKKLKAIQAAKEAPVVVASTTLLLQPPPIAAPQLSSGGADVAVALHPSPEAPVVVASAALPLQPPPIAAPQLSSGGADEAVAAPSKKRQRSKKTKAAAKAAAAESGSNSCSGSESQSECDGDIFGVTPKTARKKAMCRISGAERCCVENWLQKTRKDGRMLNARWIRHGGAKGATMTATSAEVKTLGAYESLAAYVNKKLAINAKNPRCWTRDIATRRWTSIYKSFKEALRLESKGFSKAGVTLSEITLPHTRSPSHTLPHSLPRTFRQTQTRCLQSRN